MTQKIIKGEEEIALDLELKLARLEREIHSLVSRVMIPAPRLGGANAEGAKTCLTLGPRAVCTSERAK